MYQDYTIYNINTGRVIGNGYCVETQVGIQPLADDQDIVFGAFDTSYRINPDTFEAEKIFVPYTDAPATCLGDLQKYADNDDLLNKAIQNLEEDPASFRLAHWETFRRWSYPSMKDYLDAQVKLSDPAYASEGQTEMTIYYQKCLDTKTRFPKP